VPTTDFWTPVTRDMAFERRLLAEVAELLTAEPGPETDR
jgi:hypothetical protein